MRNVKYQVLPTTRITNLMAEFKFTCMTVDANKHCWMISSTQLDDELYMYTAR